MAACAIDEAVRNCVAVGADPRRIAILDNFCWGYTDRPETLGALVRAALACHDVAIALGTPFISGKDSLNNEFSYERRRRAADDSDSAFAADQRPGAGRRCSPLRDDGSEVAGQSALSSRRDEERAGRLAFRNGMRRCSRPTCPKSMCSVAKRTFAAMHEAIDNGLIRACHDLSEGGLAVALPKWHLPAAAAPEFV